MQYSAIRLFLSSARQVQPDFVLTAENLPAIVRICHLVQGMPLAIVLAAAWVPVLSPAEIATEVSRSLDFLEADVRDVPERHRSLRAVFDHSWNLLPEWEQDALMQLSVFCGGFTRQAAQRVAGASLRELRALVSKSLLYRAAVPSAGPFDELRTGGRYEMHELVQQYAADKLERSPEAAHVVRDRHCAYFAAALQRWVEDLQGPRQRAALAERIVESENARLAWDWAVEQGHITRLGQALAGMSSFYQLQARYQEGEAACRIASEKLAAMAVAERQALSRGACSLACLRAQVLTWQSVFCQLLERTKLARQLLRQSLGLLNGPELTGHDTRAEKAFALLQAGILTEDSDRGQARRLFEQSLALYQAVGDQWGTANVLDRLGWLHRYTGTYDQAQKRFQEGLAIRRALGDRIGIADTLWGLCGVAMRQGKLELAERLARKSSAIYQTLGDRLANAVRFESLGDTLVDVGKFAEGRTVLEKSRTTFDDLGIRRGYAHAHVALSAANLHVGQYEQARALAHQGITLWQDLGLKGSTAFARYVLGNVALAQEAYAEAQELLQQTIVLYQACEPVSEVAWVLASMAVAAQGLGQVAQARQHLGTALRTATDIRSFLALVDVLPAVALFLTGQGEHERAVELYALASRYPRVANSQWFRDVAGNHVAAGAATLPPDVVVAAQSRGRERDLEAAVAELLVEFVKT
jgi:tetratricopeptide (TPR) repeat protein